MLFALALSSNVDRDVHFKSIYHALCQLGQAKFSSIYQIPCRDGVGAAYWNSACLLECDLSVSELIYYLKQLEQQAGRVRPSHTIPLDVDLIAWGQDLNSMQFVEKKLPLPLDVKIPLVELWQHQALRGDFPSFPVVLADL